jgi:hypothetical protein
MTQEDLNYQAVRSLINVLKNKTSHKFKIVFTGKVIYITNFGIFEDIVSIDIPIKGDSYSVEVVLDNMFKSKIFNPDKFHLGFKMLYSSMYFDSDNNQLIIKGNSTKMNGNYEVKIKEI